MLGGRVPTLPPAMTPVYEVPEQPGNQRLFDFLYLFSYKHICTLIHNKVTFPIYLEYLLLTYFKIKV